jgi:hypothetical protein
MSMHPSKSFNFSDEVVILFLMELKNPNDLEDTFEVALQAAPLLLLCFFPIVEMQRILRFHALVKLTWRAPSLFAFGF